MICFRFKNLVYIPTFKNASSTYSKFFSNLGWTPGAVDFLDWDGDIIFSHISDPYNRHIKGIVEFLKIKNLIECVDDPKFLTLVSHGFFDQHSYPLHMMLGEKVNKIYWIPIDHPGASSQELTCKFLKKHNVSVDQTTIIDEHVTTDLQTHNARQKILHQCQQANFRNNQQFFALDFDNLIYQSCVKKFNNWI